MRFQLNDKTYVLEFERNYKRVEVFKKKRSYQVRSQYPYTTATLKEILPGGVVPNRKIVASATVGCTPQDHFTNATGRLLALRQLSIALRAIYGKKESKPLIAAVWGAYENRGTKPLGKVIEGTVIPEAKETVH